MRIKYVGDRSFGTWVEQILQHNDASSGAKLCLELSASPAAEEVCDLLLVEGLTATEMPYGNPVVVHVVSSASETLPDLGHLRAHHYVIVRGPHELHQLRALLALAKQRSQSSNFAKAISGPFSHDVRGVIGVVNLAAQVLSANEQNERMGKKLVAVGLKMSELLETVDTLTPVSLDQEEDEAILESWTTLLASLEAWFHASHRSRQLEVERNASPKSELQHRSLSVILRAMVDAATRYSPASATISVQIDELHRALLVQVSDCICSEQQAIALAASPKRWTHSGSNSVPWRLWVAQQLAVERGARFEADLTAGLALRFYEQAV